MLVQGRDGGTSLPDSLFTNELMFKYIHFTDGEDGDECAEDVRKPFG